MCPIIHLATHLQLRIAPYAPPRRSFRSFRQIHQDRPAAGFRSPLARRARARENQSEDSIECDIHKIGRSTTRSVDRRVGLVSRPDFRTATEWPNDSMSLCSAILESPFSRRRRRTGCVELPFGVRLRSDDMLPLARGGRLLATEREKFCTASLIRRVSTASVSVCSRACRWPPCCRWESGFGWRCCSRRPVRIMYVHVPTALVEESHLLG